MKFVKRNSIFETNSSSSHNLTFSRTENAHLSPELKILLLRGLINHADYYDFENIDSKYSNAVNTLYSEIVKEKARRLNKTVDECNVILLDTYKKFRLEKLEEQKSAWLDNIFLYDEELSDAESTEELNKIKERTEKEIARCEDHFKQKFDELINIQLNDIRCDSFFNSDSSFECDCNFEDYSCIYDSLSIDKNSIDVIVKAFLSNKFDLDIDEEW